MAERPSGGIVRPGFVPQRVTDDMLKQLNEHCLVTFFAKNESAWRAFVIFEYAKFRDDRAAADAADPFMLLYSGMATSLVSPPSGWTAAFHQHLTRFGVISGPVQTNIQPMLSWAERFSAFLVVEVFREAVDVDGQLAASRRCVDEVTRKVVYLADVYAPIGYGDPTCG